MNMEHSHVILASASTYRAELLKRVLGDFQQIAADVDERRIEGETPDELVHRLAETKARKVADSQPGHIVIGSDQIAALDATILGKPWTLARAHTQLRACSARTVSFHTAVCVVDARSAPIHVHHAIDITHVQFRPIDDATVTRYLAREDVLDCAGSFKVECLGISLFERIDSEDPTALTGLPLIACCRLLRACGLVIP